MSPTLASAAAVRSGLDVKLRSLRYGARTLASEHPIYLEFARRTHSGGAGKTLAPDTQIMIEGFTRSASTFAVVAFQLAQPAPVRVASHLHASGHLIAAAKRNLPTIACVREPQATVLSAVIREAKTTIPQVLWSYARFYERILAYSSSFVIGRFEEVTNNFGSVTERVNRKFGTHFSVFEQNQENVDQCFELIDLRAGRPPWRKEMGEYLSGLTTRDELQRAIEMHADARREELSLSDQFVARPSAKRYQMKDALKDQYWSPGTSEVRVRAERAYNRFLEAAEQS